MGECAGGWARAARPSRLTGLVPRRMHPNLTKGFGMIGPKDFFPLLDFAFMPNNSLPPRYTHAPVPSMGRAGGDHPGPPSSPCVSPACRSSCGGSTRA